MTVELVTAERKHIGRVANRMRAIDKLECEAMGREPKRALRLALATSEKALTALVDGRPEAMFGVIVDSALSGKATPWFLGTDEVYRHGRELLAWGPEILADFGDSMRSMSNLVCADNDKALRLLRRWGFQVDAETVEVRGVPFHRFAMEMA